MAEEQPTARAPGVCAGCGQALRANAPGGLCPACLMRRGIELISAARPRPGAFIAPSGEDLALLFPEFAIVERLGQGGMGAVYKAVQRELDRTVAIKVLPPETATDAEFIERFRREAAALAHLDHPNIVRLFDYGQREDFAYFVMEFVDGVDLARRIAAGPLPASEAFAIVGQLCDALQHSHECGVVHRDIKPANILIAQDGRVKVADFGLARLLYPGGEEMGLTRTHTALGTPRYMAPEQMAGAGTTDQRIDIYALGVVFYEMLTGNVPVGHFDPPSEKVVTLNPRVDEVVLRALSTEPERRFATASEVKNSLREAIEKPAPTRRERARKLVMQVLTASALAGLIGTGGALLWTGGGARRDSDQTARPTAAALASGRLVVFGQTPGPFAGENVAAAALAAARDEFGLVLRSDGSVAAWGDNRFGQTDVPRGLNEVQAIAAGQGPGGAHALALRADGTVIGWGDNTFQQAHPPAGLNEVIAIAAGELFSLALTRDGRVLAWGHKGIAATAPPDDLPPAKSIAAGADFGVALLRDGRVVAWGDNSAGQCNAPQTAAPVVEIAAGSRHVLARLQSGKVLAWGGNEVRQCEVPATLPASARIFAGGNGSAAVDGSGRLHVWGEFPGGVETFAGRVSRVAIGSSTWALTVADGN